MSYLLDSNVFIQAKNMGYSPNICPGFWEWIIKSNSRALVFSIDKVADEIAKGSDELTAWAKENNHLFYATDINAAARLKTVSLWVESQQYEPAAINTFFTEAAGYYLIAHALAGNHIVVTHEKLGNSKKHIKIPNVCKGLGLQCVTPYDMLRAEKVRFILE
jgi:hypothetical protein